VEWRFRNSNVSTPLSVTLLMMFGYPNQLDSLRLGWEVRESLYVYTMCIHNDLRTCEKVGELWSTGNSLDFEVC
jgi:hypothetical protein